MTEKPSDIDDLSPEQKRKLLAKLLASKSEGVRRAPLSFAQQRLWFLDQYEPDSPAYLIIQALRLTGPLNRSAFERSLNALVERHESLRTTIAMEEGEPVQVIAPSLTLPLSVVELQDLSAEEQETALRQRIEEEATTPLALATGPLIRTTVLEIGPEEQVFLLTLHHIISDDWSLAVLYRELGALYQAACSGKPFDLPPLPIQYADYAVWQRQWLQGEALERQLAYWREQLADLPLLDFPTDRARPASVTDHGQRHAFALSPTLLAGIRALSHEAGTTLFMTLLAPFQVLLARYSGQHDVAVGTPVANRGRQEIEGLIGFFVNTLVLRTDLAGDPSFRQILQQIRERCLQAYSHQDVPFEKVVDDLQPVRDPSRHPLFQVMFQVNQRSADTGLIPGLACVPLAIGQVPTKFDLAVAFTESPDGLRGTIDFNLDLFESETIQRLARHYETLLAGAVADPEQPISQLPLLDEAERQQLLVDWTATATAYPRDATLSDRFEAQAAATPDGVALVFEEQQLSYRELDARAHQLAGYLQRHHGVGPEVRVGLYLPRSVEMIVGVLGIIKAGGAYVPLDPNAPPGRLAFILDDADVSVVLTREAVREDLPADWSGPVVALDGEWPTIAETPATELTSGATAESLAYIMYTSGSTGVPKGTSVCQRSVLRLVMDTNYLDFGPEETFLQFGPLAFDASTLEIWGSLLHGSKLVVYPPEQASLEELARCLEEHEVSTLWLTAAIFHQMVDSQPEALSGVRQLLSGGDVLSVSHVRKVLENLPEDGVLINGYGPTENTTFTCCHVMTAGSEVGSTVPIGRPIANTQVFLLDDAMQPVPVGVYGELYIGGDGLARDYLKRPALTAEKFVPHPFSDTPGARLYRTGDRVRYRPDGVVEFQGRQDHQVKLRGYRIELGEVEAVLGQHPDVRSCVALVREDVPGDKRLVSYMVPAEESLSVSDLRGYLQERLPDYMVPAHLVTLDALPVTPNGKVDRKALPAPDGVRPDLDAAYQAPQGSVEETLAEIWANVLRVDQVGRHDNFFEVGGDSILSIQIVARASQAGLRVKPRDIFEHQTIAGLAGVVEAVGQVVTDQGIVTGPLPLSPVQRWFLEHEFVAPDHWNMAWVLEARQAIDPERLERVIEALIRQHDALRSSLVADGAEWRQELIKPDAQAPFSFIDLSHLPTAEAEAAYAQEADRQHASLDIAEGPLVRVALFRFGEDQADRVLLVIHHLVVDGVSWRILLDDLQTAYDQLTAGEAIELPSKTTSFKAWVERLVDHAGSDALGDEVDYWRSVAARPWTPLPRDIADGVNSVASTRTVAVELAREDTRALLQEVPEVYRTQINDVLLTALVDVLAQWTGQESVCLNLEGHGREELFEDVDVSRTVGWFTTIFPVVLERSHPNRPGDLLKSVKEQLRQIPRRGIGYGLLRYLRDDAETREQLGAIPEPEIAFNYLGQFDQVIASEGPWVSSDATRGAHRDPRQKQPDLVSIDARITNGVLQVHWSYSDAVHRRETIERLANSYLTSLLATIRHCQSPEAGGYTPSDFPLAAVNQAELDTMWLQGIAQGPYGIADLYSLAPMQQGLWFHELLDPESGTYFVSGVTQIGGPLDRDAFRRAWEAVVARHPILRTRIVWEGLEHPLQLVQKSVELPWAEEDWSDSLADEHHARLSDFLDAERVRGLDLAQAPLIRLTLIRVAEHSSLFVWSFHHLILDRWSVDVVLQEVWSAYEALTEGHAPRLRSLRPYRDYLQWLQGQDLGQAEQFWRQTLNGFTAPTVLGIDQAPGSSAGHQEDHHDLRDVTFSETDTMRLSRWAREQKLTLNTLIQGAWSLLLARYSATEDVVFGATVSGRSVGLSGIESMVGLLINTLPVRVQVSPGDSLVEWLSSLQEQQVALREYEYTPLLDLQKWSEVPAGEPLFNTLVVFENTPQESGDSLTTRVAGLDVRPIAGRGGDRTDYPLNLIVVPGRALRLKFTYDTRHYTAEAVDRMLGHFRQALAEIVGGSGQQRLGEISLLTEAERQQLLVDWNSTATAYPREATLAERFEAQAASAPDAVALVFEDQWLTYAELNTRANRLARYLQQHYGVGPEVCVGVCMERSADMVVAILGILKAGGAYVPLDPDAPPGRLAFMLEDADVVLVVTQDDFRAHLPAEWAGPVINVDAEWSAIAQSPAANVTSGVTAGHLAYIMYTSGSTGQPKGIGIPQRAVARLVLETDYIDLTATDRVAQVATSSFDAATFELWGALLNGGQLVIIPKTIALSPQDLAAHLQQHGITAIFLTTALFNHMAREAPRAFEGVRHLLFGGEAVDPRWVREVLQVAPPQRLLHVYGPTENTTFTTWHLTETVRPEATTVPIGRPIANTQAYVLDRAMQPVPVGAYGELYVGGDGLARNYLKRPALTAEKFVPDPFSDTPGARLYRTGDMVRYRPDGALEFRGRQDHQVKLRGFRIELGEIEAVLGQHPDVRSCIALVREDAPGDKRLVGYVVSEGTSLSTGDLRRYLQERLPDYMVPAHLVMLDALPLTPNGKVDRKALPAPDGLRPDLDTAYQAPQGPVEQTLAETWADVLRIDQIGRHDNFFEVGGDSILGIQIVARASQAGLRVKPRDIFEYQTIAGLAGVVETVGEITTDQGLVTGSLPLSPVQRWFFAHQFEQPGHWNMTWVLEARQALDPEKLEQVVGALLRQHDALRLRFAADRGGWTQELSEPDPQVPFSLVDLSALSVSEAEAAYAQEADRLQASLDLAEGPLVRVALFRFGKDQADRVLLVIHHLAVDGISWRILLEDLQTAYEQLTAGRAIELPPKTTSFKAWAERLVDYARSDTLNDEAEYWQTIADAPRAPLPRDFADGVNTVASARIVASVLEREDTQALLQEIPEVYHTQVNDVLLTALVDVLAQWTGQETVSLHLEGHGREELFEDVDLSRTVGWFTTIFPVVLQRGNPDHPGDLLKSVKEQLRQIPRRGIGYGLLRYLTEDAEILERLGESPEPEIAFNYLGQFDQVTASEGPWVSSDVTRGVHRDPRQQRPDLVTINARVMDGVLQVDWTYGEAVHRRETIERLADDYLAALVSIIRHCQSPEAGGYTPSDFPLAGISQADLEKLL